MQLKNCGLQLVEFINIDPNDTENQLHLMDRMNEQ